MADLILSWQAWLAFAIVLIVIDIFTGGVFLAFSIVAFLMAILVALGANAQGFDFVFFTDWRWVLGIYAVLSIALLLVLRSIVHHKKKNVRPDVNEY